MMRDAGSTPKLVYLHAVQRQMDELERIRMLRKVFGLSLAEAKEVWMTADGSAATLSKHQEKLLPVLESMFEETE